MSMLAMPSPKLAAWVWGVSVGAAGEVLGVKTRPGLRPGTSLASFFPCAEKRRGSKAGGEG